MSFSRSVVVIGGANADVIARPHQAPVEATSNPGRVTVTAGGVGRNIAENLARLGTETYLVSAIGSDAHGELVLESTAGAGVDVDHVRRVIAPTGTYVALLDPEGELRLGISDMAATAELGLADIRAAAEVIAQAGLVVLDGNLGSEALEAAWDAAVTAGVPVVIDPVSVPKAGSIASMLHGRTAYLVSAGTEELVALGGSAAALRAAGAELVWERAGAGGSVLHSASGITRLPAAPAEVVDVTGAGDAMLAAFCHSVLSGDDPQTAAAYAHVAAALTVASRHTVRPDLSDALVRSLL